MLWWVLIGTTLELYVSFGRIIIFTELVFLTHGHGRSFQFSSVFLNYFLQKFKVFVVEVSHLPGWLLIPLNFFPTFFFFELRFCVVQAVLKLSTKMIMNFWSSCLHCRSVGTTGMCHHTVLCGTGIEPRMGKLGKQSTNGATASALLLFFETASYYVVSC